MRGQVITWSAKMKKWMKGQLGVQNIFEIFECPRRKKLRDIT